jgi:hypothetical protein
LLPREVNCINVVTLDFIEQIELVRIIDTSERRFMIPGHLLQLWKNIRSWSTCVNNIEWTPHVCLSNYTHSHVSHVSICRPWNGCRPRNPMTRKRQLFQMFGGYLKGQRRPWKCTAQNCISLILVTSGLFWFNCRRNQKWLFYWWVSHFL